MLMDSKIVNYVSLVCHLVLAFIAFINWFVVGGMWIDSFFRMIFLVTACVFTGCAPFGWIKFIKTHFPFLLMPLWRSGFIVLLACFFFPCFYNGCWYGWSRVFQNIAALVLFVLGLIQFILEIVDWNKKRTISQPKTNTQPTVVVTEQTVVTEKVVEIQLPKAEEQ
ncbi:Hypothetical_protein [Hexamita inflata]|uniref:Hypothetical_protein n=1 Tax=Hexamita inflata TaxID=28002 RepID=A0AA86UY76_9EUKA|nr:Hypothetical protein HINF_LOCUS56897 [Hexamita inflata]